ncbi:MAG: hypothetical protein ACXVIY_11880, partial [Mucilaginibacter sp.]
IHALLISEREIGLITNPMIAKISERVDYHQAINTRIDQPIPEPEKLAFAPHLSERKIDTVNKQAIERRLNGNLEYFETKMKYSKHYVMLIAMNVKRFKQSLVS